MLQHRLRAGGPWQKLMPGVYVAVTGGVSTNQREMGALLHAGPQSVLTGLAAARRHGISGPTSTTVDVLVPAKLRPQSTSFVRVWRTWRMPAEVCVASEIRYVPPARAVADAVRAMTNLRDARALVAQAIQRQRCSIAQLEAELAQGPVKGSAALRAALEEVRAGVRSAPEGDLRRLIKRGRIPMPVFNARLYAGRKLVAVVDAWWEDWQGTIRRHDRLVAHGVLLLHFTPQQIRTAPDEVTAQVQAALAAGRGRARLPITARSG
jgi:hypothetical protein